MAGTLQHGGHPTTVPEDDVRIADAPDAKPAPAAGPDAARGSFVSRCGRNADGHRNSDNFIVSPGVSNGAHHMHDYVGNVSADGNSTDESLAVAGTTCRFGDRSTYFWPVLRDIRRAGDDADQPGGGQDGNLGTIITPASVTLQFRGNAQAKVVAMPRFLRIVTGDAKAVTNGPNAPNARAQWTCSGTRGKVSSTQYPICPRGQLVQRISDFPGCWDGITTDSANHRTHTSFADPTTGACPEGTTAIPQLRITLSYQVPSGLSGIEAGKVGVGQALRRPGAAHAGWLAALPVRRRSEARAVEGPGVSGKWWVAGPTGAKNLTCVPKGVPKPVAPPADGDY